MGRPRINTVCTVDGCGKRAVIRQLCAAHRSRLREHGSVSSGTPVRRSLRGLSVVQRVAQMVVVDDATGCWNWQGRLNRQGYGTLTVNRITSGAHRVSYELASGPVPSGLVLDHLCRNRACVNPAHLEAVTSRENIMRGVGIAPKNAAKTHCAHGHLLSGDNLYQFPDGRRECRTCSRETKRRYKLRQRVA